MALKKRIKALSTALAIGVAAATLGACASSQQAAPVAVTAEATQPAPELTTADVEAFLDGHLPGALNAGKIPGAIVTVVKDGHVVTTRGYGYSDIETKTPVTEDTLFRVGSIGKIPTTIAALQLVEQGKMDLDADIATYVDVPIERQFDQPITLRNLLTHTAGFEERFANVVTYDKDTYDLIGDVLSNPPEQVYAPGSTVAYSNYGMALVGYLVQQVSGVPYEKYVQDNVLAPAGMASSTYAQPLPEELADRMSTDYVNGYQEGPGFATLNAPAGSLTASGKDFAAFMIAQMEEGKLLRPETMAMAMTPQGRGEALASNDTQLGLGYFLKDHGGVWAAGHGGDTPSFHSEYALFPEQETGIFISLNSDGEQASHLDLRMNLIGAFADRYFPAETTPAPDAAESRQRAEQIAGTYTSARGFHSTFLKVTDSMPGSSPVVTAEEDGSLTLIAGWGTRRFEEVEPWIWQEVGGAMTLRADTSGEQPRLSAMGEADYLPATTAAKVSFPLSIASLLGLSAVLLLWPMGAVRRWWQQRSGRASAAPLSWAGRIARLAGLCALAAAGIWYGSMLMMMTSGVPEVALPVAGVLQWVGVLGLIPAAVAVAQAIRHRHGWGRILVGTVLLLALGGVCLWAVWNNMLTFNFTY